MDLDPDTIEAAARAKYESNRYGLIGWEFVPEHNKAVYREQARSWWPIIAAEVERRTKDAIADRIVKLAPYNCELLPDGREDPRTAAWVEGIKDASKVASSFTSAPTETKR